MKQWQRLAFYLLLNVCVSAITVLVVLFLWDLNHPKVSEKPPESTAVVPNKEITTPEASTLDIESGATPSSSSTEMDVEEYQVKANDTLGEIAASYGVSVEEILKINGLSDPNAISVGMVIYIPVTPEVESFETPESTRTPSLVTGTPGASQQTGNVVINSVIGVGDLASERVFISRTGSGSLLLAGWQLRDESGNTFTFPYLELFEGGAVNVWTSVGSATPVDLYWGQTLSIWQAGETVTLVDDQGKIRATYKIP